MSARTTDKTPEETQAEHDFRVLFYGVDTVYLSWSEQVTAKTYENLLAEKKEAQAARKERNAVYCSDWLDAQVYPTGADGFQVLIDRAGEWTIKVQHGNKQRPGIYLEMRSKTLHTHPGGPWAACEEALAWIRDTLYADASAQVQSKLVMGKEKLSRYDIHLDWQGGWCPTLEPGEYRQFIKPSRVGWEPHMSGDICTGYTFGKRRIMARIYNKTKQATHEENDEYFELVRQQAGDQYDPTQDIWRVEFQLRREGVEGFCIVTEQEDYDDQTIDEQIAAEIEGEDLPTLGTLKKAMRYTPHLWQYLTTRWLWLTVPNGDKNKARWPMHPVWQQIQAAVVASNSEPLSEEQCRLVREQRHSGRRRIIARLSTAITTSAWLMMHSDPTLAVRDFTDNVRHMARQMVRYQQEKRRRGRQRLKDALQERYAECIEYLAHEAGGLFATMGVLQQEIPAVDSMEELAVMISGELEKMAQYKGGVRQMLYDKWCREYKVSPTRRMFRIPDEVVA